jgi:isopentenyl diphosphate isomerase/L-lactate dehydrogenase-like FMN-dependent dehydrogenase
MFLDIVKALALGVAACVVGAVVMSQVMMGPLDKYLNQQEIDEILNTQESK